MSHRLRTSCIPFSMTGTGTEVQKFDLFGDGGAETDLRYSGRIRRLVIREAAGGGATAGTFYIVHLTDAYDHADPAAIGAEKIVVETSSVPLTASATAASLDSPIDAEPTFQDKAVLYVKVTAGSGAWTIVGFVEIER